MGQMVIAVGADDKFHALLLELDRLAAQAVRASGCPQPWCGGRLDVANYPRKVRGIGESAEAAGQYGVRFSLCCSVRGCRRRATPPSVRFLGRFVYAMRVMVTWAASRASPTMAPPAAPPSSPSRQTSRRWEEYWGERVKRSAAMALLVSALMVSPGRAANVVVALMGTATGTEVERTVRTHRLLAPLTTATVPPERARSSMLR